MKRYLYDDEFFFTRYIRVRPIDPYPVRSTTVKPPRLKDEQVAKWNGAEWTKLPERPAKQPKVNSVLSAEDFHIRLHKAGFLDAAEAHFTANRVREIKWIRRAEFKRDSAFVRRMQETLDLTDVQIDNLFIAEEEEEEEEES